MKNFSQNTCITYLFESAGLTLVSRKNGSYTSKEYDSLIIHGKNSPKYPNTFYWNSLGIGGGFAKAKKAIFVKKNRFLYENDFSRSFDAVLQSYFWANY